jgi:hypothetical protein
MEPTTGHSSAKIVDDLAMAHSQLDRDEIIRLRALSVGQRAALIESACETAAIIRRSRLAAGLGDIEPAPWPASTWQFLKEHTARAGA